MSWARRLRIPRASPPEMPGEILPPTWSSRVSATLTTSTAKTRSVNLLMPIGALHWPRFTVSPNIKLLPLMRSDGARRQPCLNPVFKKGRLDASPTQYIQFQTISQTVDQSLEESLEVLGYPRIPHNSMIQKLFSFLEIDIHYIILAETYVDVPPVNNSLEYS